MKPLLRCAIWCAIASAVAVSGSAARLPQAARESALIDSGQLLRDLQVLSADDMEGRQVDTPGGAKARAYVVQRFKESGVAPFGASYIAPFTFTSGGSDGGAGRKGANVIGHVDGTDKSVRYIVVSAHYDHIGKRNGQVFNGADDNASGTAALFALAKYFNQHRPVHALLFAAFDGEEVGLRGSRAFVADPPVDRMTIIIDINLDMIGRDPNDKLFVVGTYLNPFLKPYVERVAASAPVKLLIGHDDPTQRGTEDWTRDSDHYSFLQVKIPALYVGVEDYDQHHKATDDYETISSDFYVRAVETALAIVKEIDAHLDAIARRQPGRPTP